MRLRLVGAACCVLAGLTATSCSNPLGRQYEYEEQLYLSVDGAASVIVNASLPALVALRGLPVDASPDVRPDREAIRQLLEQRGCEVDSVGQPWTRRGRRFIQMRVSAAEVETLGRCGLLSWSTYALGPDPARPESLRFTQAVGAPAGKAPAGVSWDGSEVVGFKLHLPSTIHYHNVRRLEDGEPGEVERGNILSYEQRLADRIAGRPVQMDVVMGDESILARTLVIFAIAIGAAIGALALAIWITVRRVRARVPDAGPRAG